MTADPWADSIPPAHEEDAVTDTPEEESATFAAFKVKGTGREHEDIVLREKNLPPANTFVPVTIVDSTINESTVPWHDGEQALFLHVEDHEESDYFTPWGYSQHFRLTEDFDHNKNSIGNPGVRVLLKTGAITLADTQSEEGFDITPELISGLIEKDLMIQVYYGKERTVSEPVLDADGAPIYDESGNEITRSIKKPGFMNVSMQVHKMPQRDITLADGARVSVLVKDAHILMTRDKTPEGDYVDPRPGTTVRAVNLETGEAVRIRRSLEGSWVLQSMNGLDEFKGD